MNPFTGRPEWEPEAAVLAEIERSTQEVGKRESRNPIVRCCGLCFILGLLGVGVLSLCSPPVATSRHAQPAVSRPVRAHPSTHVSRRQETSAAWSKLAVNSQGSRAATSASQGPPCR